MKIYKVILLSILMISLSACNPLRNFAEKSISDNAQLINTKEYQTYNQYLEEGKIDKNGNLNIIDFDSEEKIDGSVRVTFGKNSLMTINYFFDEAKTQLIDTEKCYLNPGDTIYASVITDTENIFYSFDKFEGTVYEDTNYLNIEIDSSNIDSKKFTIPNDYKYNNLIVLPIGKFNARDIILDAFYNDDNGKHSLGEWIINNEKKDSSTQPISINNPNLSGIIYDYSSYKDDYYVLNNSLINNEHAMDNPDDGIVTFRDLSASDETNHLIVELKPHITLTINNPDGKNLVGSFDNIKSISINDIEQDIKALKYSKLKIGDKVKIVVDEAYKLSSPDFSFKDKNGIKKSEGFEYTLTMKDISGRDASITIRKISDKDGAYEQKNIDNGEIIVKREDGNALTDGDDVSAKEKVEVIIKPNNNYYITGKNIQDGFYTETMTFEKYMKNIDSIIENHPIKKYITVYLDENDDFGTVEFYVNKEKVSGSIVLKEKDKITLEYSLNNTDYQIEGTSGLAGIGKDKYKKKVTITIENDLDQKTIRRDDYIQIVKGE